MWLYIAEDRWIEVADCCNIVIATDVVRAWKLQYTVIETVISCSNLNISGLLDMTFLDD